MEHVPDRIGHRVQNCSLRGKVNRRNYSPIKIESMKTEFKDVAPFYLGCTVQTESRRATQAGKPMIKLKGQFRDFDMDMGVNHCGVLLEDEKDPLNHTNYAPHQIKPLMRPIQFLTAEEILEYAFIAMYTDELPDEDQVTRSEVSVSCLRPLNNGIRFDISCRCFEGRIEVGERGDIHLFDEDGVVIQSANQARLMHFLLAHHIDLFGLIESGQAINSTLKA